MSTVCAPEILDHPSGGAVPDLAAEQPVIASVSAVAILRTLGGVEGDLRG